MPYAVYLATENNPAYLAVLQRMQLPSLQVTNVPSEANIVLAAPPLAAKRLHEFINLQWLQSTYAGVDALLQPSLRTDYLLTKVQGIFGQQMAEYVMGLGLYYSREFEVYQRYQQAKHWQPLPYQTVAKQTLVTVGTGSIGSALAKAAKAFDMHVIGVNRSGLKPEGAPFDEIFEISDLPQAIERANWLVNTLPNTPDTYGVFDQTTLSAGQQVLFFNVGRGNAVCLDALQAALESGAVRRAFLDVFDQEPLPSEHPVWLHPRVVITPHIAAPSVPEQVLELFAKNYELWLAGEPLNGTVNPTLGY